MFGLYESTVTSQVMKNMKKIQNIDSFQKYIKDVYDMKMQSNELTRLIKNLSFDFGYGTLYNIIRDKLQNVCRIHKSYISSSTATFFLNSRSLCRVNVPASPDYQQDSNLKVHEVVTRVLYYHFSSISTSNKQVCQMWEIIKDKVPVTNTDPQLAIRVPDLKLSTLNYLALKQLIPQTEFINASDFKNILVKLHQAKFVTKKEHIQQLLEVYSANQIFKEVPKTQSVQKQTASINNSAVVKSTTEVVPKKSVKTKNSSGSNDFKTQKSEIVIKSRQNEIKISSTSITVSMDEFDYDDDSHREEQWLKKAKQNPIAKQLIQRLKMGGKFCKNQSKKAMTEKVAQDVVKQMLFDNFSPDADRFRIIRTSQIMKAYEDKLKAAEQKYEDAQNKIGKKISIDQKESQAAQKKKKRKNKKKKTKNTNDSDGQQNQSQLILTATGSKQEQKLQQQFELKQNKQIKEIKQKPISQIKDRKQIVNKNTNINGNTKGNVTNGHSTVIKQNKDIYDIKQDIKAFGETIKMLKDMKIDDKRRATCYIEVRKLEDWRKNTNEQVIKGQ